MKRIKKSLGLAFMALGTVLLVVLHVFRLTFVNALLLTPLALVFLGLVLYVWALKQESKY